MSTAEDSALHREAAGGAIGIVVASTWDGQPIAAPEQVRLRLSGFDEFLLLEVEAPFYDDPPPAAPAGSTPGLWDYEVVELFVSGPGEQYTEIEVGPHGHYLLLRLDGLRCPVEEGLELQVETAISGNHWRGRLVIPRDLIPQGPHKLAAYAIHGQGAQRRYLAAFPVPGEAPDFHRLDRFEPVLLP